MEIRILLVHNPFSWHPITWLSGLIQLVTGGKYNHIVIEVEGEYVIEAVWPKVVRRSVEEWGCLADREVLPMTPPPLSLEQYSLLLSFIGKRYSAFDLIRAGWHYLVTKRIGADRKRQPYNGKGYICSELACLLLGIDWFIVPFEFEYLNILERGEEFKTVKK